MLAANGADSPFGDPQETDTRYGFHALVGAGIKLGPGRVLLEIDFGYTPITERVTGRSNVGSLSVLVGYGLML